MTRKIRKRTRKMMKRRKRNAANFVLVHFHVHVHVHVRRVTTIHAYSTTRCVNPFTTRIQAAPYSEVMENWGWSGITSAERCCGFFVWLTKNTHNYYLKVYMHFTAHFIKFTIISQELVNKATCTYIYYMLGKN